MGKRYSLYELILSRLERFKMYENSQLCFGWSTKRGKYILAIWRPGLPTYQHEFIYIDEFDPPPGMDLDVYQMIQVTNGCIHEMVPGIDQTTDVRACECPSHKGWRSCGVLKHQIGELWICDYCMAQFTRESHGKWIVIEEKERKKRFEEDQKKRERQRRPLKNPHRVRVFMRDDYKCKICGRGPEDGVKLHVDHIHPVAKGGTDDAWNLQTLCGPCNRSKSDKIIELPGA